MNNELKYLVIHCSATPAGRDVRAEEVIAWHEARWGKGRIGYRSFVELSGNVVRLRAANQNEIVEPEEVTWGVTGINKNAHHVCYAGGLSRDLKRIQDTRTDGQKKALENIVKTYLRFAPNIQIGGHNQFDNKACPSFWVPAWLREIGVPERNIYQADPYGYKSYFRRF
jgi:hypothetical protein